MCTVSWRLRPGGYDLFFNRDERHARAPELPPEIAESEGGRFIAPRDGEHGGTWLLANDTGLTVCLLNDYAASWRPEAELPRFSRGHIVSACAAAASHRDVLAVLKRQPLSATPAFHLMALSVQEGPLVLHWQGAKLMRRVASQTVPPLSSSSFATEEVVAARLAKFGALVAGFDGTQAVDLQRYHEQHDARAGAHSVLMHRPDAATRSIIHVAAETPEISLEYRTISWTNQGPILSPSRRWRLTSRTPASAAA